MPRLTVDGVTVNVPQGATILEAANQAGAAIPTLCHVPGLEASASCMVCVVKVEGVARLVPSCAMPAADGMVVITDDAEIRSARRTAVALLLGAHAGDCEAPCETVCPLRWPIPRLLRALQRGQGDQAAALAVQCLVLPRTLGHICPAPCEKACRRGRVDRALAIRALHRVASDAAGGSERVRLPVGQDSGKRVAVVGAGPAGLGAAVELRRLGHGCVLIDRETEPGGALRSLPVDRLPSTALAADLQVVLDAGIETEFGTGLLDARDLDRLAKRVDAVILCLGAPDLLRLFDVTANETAGASVGCTVTSHNGVFAAGGCLKPGQRLAVRALSQGREAARMAHAFLVNEEYAPKQPYQSRLGAVSAIELDAFRREAIENVCEETMPDADTPGNNASADVEAGRCLHCDCRSADDCRLRQVATALQVSSRDLLGTRPAFEQDRTHARVLFEPGKCIACGHCVRIASECGEANGPAFVGRGFDLRVAPPTGTVLREALTIAAERCVAACPTGALAWREEAPA